MGSIEFEFKFGAKFHHCYCYFCYCCVRDIYLLDRIMFFFNARFCVAVLLFFGFIGFCFCFWFLFLLVLLCHLLVFSLVFVGFIGR
ncbi:hypothetical protein BZA77DRAFT_40367 [Pyronema omphalodes]|nr:hypothetical protein BZA77DRAFT_40367 [Pyronema omphalodes]